MSNSIRPDELVTARLRLRQWRPDDEADMAAIDADPEVTRYLNRPPLGESLPPFLTRASAHWERHGFGLWAVESRELELGGRCLGFVGLAHPVFLPELAHRPEIGWRLARDVWGRGLATEGALAAKEYARHTLGLTELISIIHPGNARSQRVAVKLGMVRAQRVHNPLMDCEIDVWSTHV